MRQQKIAIMAILSLVFGIFPEIESAWSKTFPHVVRALWSQKRASLVLCGITSNMKDDASKKDRSATAYLRNRIFTPQRCRSVSTSVQELLPVTDTCIIAAEDLPGGMSNNVTKYTTYSGNQYILRVPKKLEDRDRFNKIISISQKAARLQLAPSIHSFNDMNQYTLMRYIPSVPWPSFEHNAMPYGETMRSLRKFHDEMRAEALQNNPINFQPFAAILAKEKSLADNPHMPSQLRIAFDKMKILYEKVLPWLKEHATVYHGDFKKDNVVLEQQEDQLYPWLIDFDSANIGHPYFDVVKFSQKLSQQQRLLLFEIYLGHSPAAEEVRHFAILDNALRMLVALIRFDVAIKAQASADSSELLSKEDMEELLNSLDPLPLQSTILLSNPDPKKQQLAAIYALHDFLMHLCIKA